ncbi:hypothetical protein CcaverHIS002_0109890 [Cutaneotrichosporon cavernicola]|uniref:N-acetyltransferase domain-containing protein n=1 Tax=Cutaneotrichosporon cavernicola TaxID=279322 RepID=A0AA48II38_9TREE|nr:uncharacterized protein CcaverHIS019_0109810 [Cutaneotrichosporon cavernicola]BEI80460.1 hypothetical protein CcaverHIS002_0109890 [Cutaneotrichosporon cavernicola]BEI88263.1 hypothetical protein CcaverHIS019_0109810 [Cutaneotrichosporon cavernicola]BEI96035.1 hypothetical protein CcaverHIS631_0109840 [Cutaneotrichosporon cavernicola]BEJ03808.1 hypothetical protein CcaverHIS641_0109830 [Cutaneotrichosporon cavernicola]
MVDITSYTPGAPTEALHAIWQATLGTNPPYVLPHSKLHALLNYPTARVFVASLSEEVVGWALTYTIRSGCAPDPKSQHLRGGLAVLLVHPNHQKQGIGSTIHSTAIEYLETAVRGSFTLSSPPAKEGAIQLGSAFPRIFPGVPESLQHEAGFFQKRGWNLGERAIDLYGALPPTVELGRFIALAEERGVSFRPATAGDRQEVMEMEYAEFGAFCGWPDLFPIFFDAGREADIYLALREGRVIGATIAAMPGSPAHERLAWPDTLGMSPYKLG